MGKLADIEVALAQAVASSGIGLPLAVDNARFEAPADGSPWAAYFFVPAEGASAVKAVTLGADGEDEHLGIAQVDLNYPLYEGVGAARAKLDQLALAFPIGRKLSHGVAVVTVVSCSRSRGREVDGWYRVSLSISWFARVPRNP